MSSRIAALHYPASLKITILLLVLWATLAVRLNAPWFGDQDANRVWIASAVLNYDRYGVENIGLMVVRDVLPASAENFTYYSHHPPLAIWLPALATKLFGFHELSIRYVFIVATLLTSAAFYALTRRLYGHPIALLATAFYSFVPATMYLGRVPGYEHLGQLFAVLFALVYAQWLSRPTRGRYAQLVSLAVMCVWTSWSAVLFVGGIGFVTFWRSPRKLRIALIGVVCAAAFAVMMVFYVVQWPDALNSLMEAFLWRSSTSSYREGSPNFSTIDFLVLFGVHTAYIVTPGLIGLAVIGARSMLRGRNHAIAVGLLVGGLSYHLIFRNATYVHYYYKVTLLPAIAIGAAFGFVALTTGIRRNRFARPLRDGLILCWLAVAIAATLQLHLTGNRPDLQQVVDEVNAYPAYAIASNVRSTQVYGDLLAIQFYTYRAMRLDVPPEMVDPTVPTIYLYCGDEAPFDAPEPKTLDSGRCWLYRFEPEETTD